MYFRVIGPVEVSDDAGVVRLPGGKTRALLARLLVDAGRVVSVDSLADALWGDAPPLTVASTIQVHISNLRRLLGGSTIITRTPGYALDVDGHCFDHLLLADAVARARAHRVDERPAEALRAASDALALVRGEPYADVAFEDWAHAEVLRLGDLVMSAHEEVHAALLDLGRHREALPLLESLVAAHPFHERLRAQLMVALYRDGRQVEALRRYADGRRLLIDELGVEPGVELRQTESRVLMQDPTLGAPSMSVRAAETPQESTGEPQPADDELVGREPALATLRAMWQRARTGRLGIVLLEGESGTGKSALARRFAGTAGADGAAVGVGIAHELAGAPPYWPWTNAFRDLAARGWGEHLRAAAAEVPSAGAFSVLIDGLTLEREPLPGQQFQLFSAVAEVLEALGRERPVLLVLDDLHWADQASLDLLQFLGRSQRQSRVLIIATHLPTAGGDALSAMLANVVTESTVEMLRLGPLVGHDVQRLVERLLEQPVDPALGTSIAARTGGSPFLVVELVRQLRAESGALDLARAAVPTSVRGLVRRRADRLGEHAVEILTIASFAGAEFDDIVPARLLQLDQGVVSRVLDDAVADGLLVEVDGRTGYYRFAQQMVRHALYDSVPQRRRAETHVRFGRALVEVLAERADQWAAEIAAHFSQGIDVGSAPDAVQWLRTAAAQAIRSQAPSDAVRFLRRALFVTRSRLRDDRRECEVLVELAAAARLAADPATAQLARERAQRLATRLGEPSLAMRAGSVLLVPGPHWVRRAT
jgi:DNA-binding SARP family transcriptional activator